MSGLTKMQQQLLIPLPLIPKGSAYQEGLDVPKWRQKNTKILSSLKIKVAKQPPSPQDQQDEEEADNERDDQVKTEKEVQEKLSKHAGQIKIQNFNQIDTSAYPRFFKYQIYESYKPQNLLEARKILQFYVSQSLRGNSLTEIDGEYFKEYISYLKRDLNTSFPSNGVINEKNLLKFDSNYECGNLDSAYVVNENEYNVLMKVDTNTKGTSFWFNFKAHGRWSIKPNKQNRTVKFNILNFSKSDVKYFYHHGMGVMSMICDETKPKSDQKWVSNLCHGIEFSTNNDIERVQSSRSFYQLSFKYTFTTKSEIEEQTVMFSYCRPFTYSKILQELNEIKYKLLDPISNGQDQHATISYLKGVHNINRKQSQEDKGQNHESQKDGSNGQQERAKLTQYELEHIEIRNRGLKVIKLNSIEKAIINDSQQQDGASLFSGMKNTGQVNASNTLNILTGEEFEIKTSHLVYRQDILCRSVCGLPVYLLTISQPKISTKALRKKRVIYITSRVHAGETHSSFVMQKILTELTHSVGNEKYKYEQLLQNYVIKLVPIINPDGVAIGNARTSIIGLDLNRRWTQPNPIIHPEVFFLKRDMKKSGRIYEGVQIFCDLHGHNRAPDAFVYGCHKAANQGLLSWTKTRLLPKIIATITPLFNFKECQFKIDRCKLNTARVVCWNELKITNSFTFEISMFGKQVRTLQKKGTIDNQLSPKAGVSSNAAQDNVAKHLVQLEISDMHHLGCALLQSLLHYNAIEPELELEFQQTGGWLKVQKLNKVAGRAAPSLPITKEEGSSKKRPKDKYDSSLISGSVKKGERVLDREKRLRTQVNEKVSSTNSAGLPKKSASFAPQKLSQLKHEDLRVPDDDDDAKNPPQNENGPETKDQALVLKDFFGQEQYSTKKLVEDSKSSELTQELNFKNLSNKERRFTIDQKSLIDSKLLKSGANTAHRDNTLKRLDTMGTTTQSSTSNTIKESTQKNGKRQSTWRDYFEITELNRILKSEGEIKEEDETSQDEGGGSDSDPSENNMDPAEFLQIMETAFVGEQDVTFKDLLTEATTIVKPKKKSPNEEGKMMKPQTTLNTEAMTTTSYNFIVKPPVSLVYPTDKKVALQIEDSQNAFNGSFPAQLVSQYQRNIKQLQQVCLDNITDVYDQQQQQYNSYTANGDRRQKSPMQIGKATTTLYSGWAQSKQQQPGPSSNALHEKLRQMQKFTKVKTSTQTHRYQQQQQQDLSNNKLMGAGMLKQNLFDATKQRTMLQDIIVAGGIPRIQEIDKSKVFNPQVSKSPFIQSNAKLGAGPSCIQAIGRDSSYVGSGVPPPVKVKYSPLSQQIIKEHEYQKVKKQSTLSLSKSIEIPITKKVKGAGLEDGIDEEDYYEYDLLMNRQVDHLHHQQQYASFDTQTQSERKLGKQTPVVNIVITEEKYHKQFNERKHGENGSIFSQSSDLMRNHAMIQQSPPNSQYLLKLNSSESSSNWGAQQNRMATFNKNVAAQSTIRITHHQSQPQTANRSPTKGSNTQVMQGSQRTQRQQERAYDEALKYYSSSKSKTAITDDHLDATGKSKAGRKDSQQKLKQTQQSEPNQSYWSAVGLPQPGQQNTPVMLRRIELQKQQVNTTAFEMAPLRGSVHNHPEDFKRSLQRQQETAKKDEDFKSKVRDVISNDAYSETIQQQQQTLLPLINAAFSSDSKKNKNNLKKTLENSQNATSSNVRSAAYEFQRIVQSKEKPTNDMSQLRIQEQQASQPLENSADRQHFKKSIQQARQSHSQSVNQTHTQTTSQKPSQTMNTKSNLGLDLTRSQVSQGGGGGGGLALQSAQIQTSIMQRAANANTQGRQLPTSAPKECRWDQSQSGQYVLGRESQQKQQQQQQLYPPDAGVYGSIQIPTSTSSQSPKKQRNKDQIITSASLAISSSIPIPLQNNLHFVSNQHTQFLHSLIKQHQ